VKEIEAIVQPCRLEEIVKIRAGERGEKAV
jgi:hypothetical protein